MKPGNHKLNLRIFPDEILRRTCASVEDFNCELGDIFHEMLVLMRANNGIGLAGPQAGIPSRLFVCEIEDQVLCLANPVITIVEGEARMLEGCLSLPGIQADVLRHEQILVKGQDISGKEKKFSMTGLWARVTQHETDHLDGILISDRGKVIESESDEIAVREQAQHKTGDEHGSGNKNHFN